MSSLLNHAKEHCQIKQFQCPLCSYSAVNNESITSHITKKHNDENTQEPINSLDEDLKFKWRETMKKCFPKYSVEISQYEFNESDLQGQTPITIELGISSEESSINSIKQDYSKNTETLSKKLYQNLDDLADHESSPQLPIFDIQFNQEGCLSKIRAFKRNRENSVANSLATNSRSSSPNDVLPLKRRCKPRR